MSDAGIQMAITFLTHLKYLDYPNLRRVITILEGNFVQQPASILKSFSCNADGQLKMESNKEIGSDKWMRSISYKENVSDADLTSTDVLEPTFEHHPLRRMNRNITFRQGIQPFLTSHGSTINHISLDLMGDVDLFSIMRANPLLSTVSFFYCDHFISSVPTPPVSQHIESIEIEGYLSDDFGHNELIHLLLSPNLKNFYISSCEALCDAALVAAFRHHRFRKLETLTIKSCRNVSKDIFSSCFLSEGNQLRKIVITACPSLGTAENKEVWDSKSVSRNWELQIVVD